jgi:predicted lipid-binding transport protein (Tim44 family)
VSKKSTSSVVLNIVLLLIIAGGLSWFFFKYRQQRSDLGKKYAEASQQLTTYKTDPNAAAQAEAAKTIAEVGKLYALPKDEQPSVATVKDKAKLKDQAFFAKAENGDITLIYSTAKVAVLYRPSTKQIINVSSVTFQDQPTTP